MSRRTETKSFPCRVNIFGMLCAENDVDATFHKRIMDVFVKLIILQCIPHMPSCSGVLNTEV